MDQEILLPKISDNIDSVTVTEILVSIGDEVEEEDSLITVESEKASLEVPADVAGTIKEIKVKEGDEIKIGAVIIIISTDESSKAKETEEVEDIPATSNEISIDRPVEEVQEAPAVEVEVSQQNLKVDSKKAIDPVVSSDELHTTDKNIPVSPLARKMARDLGVNLQALMQSIDKPRITVEDVKSFADSSPAAVMNIVPSTGAIAVPDFSQWGEVERQKISSIRRITAKNTSFSWQTMPHVTHFDQADITDLEAFRKKYNTKNKTGLTITSILLKMMGIALRKFPKFNSSLDAAREELVYKRYYHVGVAADTKDGLLMPVVQNADQKGILELSDELSEMAERARNRKLRPDEMSGQTFVISNLGGIGGIGFTPVVFPNNCAILGVSRASVQPVFQKESGEFQPRLIAPLCISYDHRVIDGAEAARFMRWICEGLEQPIQLLF